MLDLGCGHGTARSDVGLDLSSEALAVAHARSPDQGWVRARAQCLPFADASFDLVVSHLAFTLMDELPLIVDELGRVLARGGMFQAVVGGGPTAHGDDAFHRFLAITADAFRGAPRLGELRARSEEGWRELFAMDRGWGAPHFVRQELDCSGTFDEVWEQLRWLASYELRRVDPVAIEAALRAAVADLPDAGTGRVPCRMVTWLGSVSRT